MSDQPAPGRVRVTGPLARFADGFRVDLIERGYSPWGAQAQLYLLAHVSRWMEAEGLELAAAVRLAWRSCPKCCILGACDVRF